MTPSQIVPAAPAPSVPVRLTARFFGMTQQVQALFDTFEEYLPDAFLPVLTLPDTVYCAHFADEGKVLRLEGYRSLPVSGEHTLVKPVPDWVHERKLWFRERPGHRRTSLPSDKHEAFYSYLDAYRPVFEVERSAPLFILNL